MNDPQMFLEQLLRDSTVFLAIAGGLVAISLAFIVWDFKRRKRRRRRHRHRHRHPEPATADAVHSRSGTVRSVWKTVTRRMRSRARQRAREEELARQMRRFS